MLRPDRIVRRAIRSRYIATTTTEETFTGVLVDADANTLVFADVQVVDAAGKQTPVNGELWLPRNTVKYLQTTKA